jgi:hypothetical protein
LPASSPCTWRHAGKLDDRLVRASRVRVGEARDRVAHFLIDGGVTASYFYGDLAPSSH